jgi:hypothetical protein
VKSLFPLAVSITTRDIQILSLLFEHRVLTIHQIQVIFFKSASVTRRRMLRLYHLGVVDRFEPPTAVGSAPYHYVLDVHGARILAAHRGIEFRDLGWTKENAEGFPWRQEFRHLMETNSFFAHLIHACRNDGATQLVDWLGENQCRRQYGMVCQPDGYGRITGPRATCSFLIEYDRGTESPARLAAKLPPYERIALLDDHPDALLICFPDSDREISARRRLYSPDGIVLATTTTALHTADPLGPVWLPSDSEQRVSLLDLGHREP